MKELGLMLLEMLEKLVCSTMFQKAGLIKLRGLPDEHVNHVEYFIEGT